MKTRFILSSFTLLLFALLAGGSAESFLTVLFGGLVSLVFIVVGIAIQAYIKSTNKKKRIKMIKQYESTDEDFDRSVSFGNDECMFYFDSSKKQVMIMRVMTEGIKKSFVDCFEFSGKELCLQKDPYFCIYDAKNRHLLCGDYKNVEIRFTIDDIANEDKHKDITPRNSIQAKLIGYTITNGYIYTLVDECHGMIAIVRQGKVSSVFNYINSKSISKKTGDKSFINTSVIGNYCFIMDEFFNVLVIVTPSSYELFNYSDIIEVSYEENGEKLYSKSAMRTVGGAIVGGVLMGGAGAVVGGLSGSSKEDEIVKTIDVKILLRSTQRSTCVLNFNDSGRILLATKNDGDKQLYEIYQKNANKAKDILSVIIDKIKQSTGTSIRQEVSRSTQQFGIADELAKLAKLKSDGIITEEEFKAQKAKLLDS